MTIPIGEYPGRLGPPLRTRLEGEHQLRNVLYEMSIMLSSFRNSKYANPDTDPMVESFLLVCKERRDGLPHVSSLQKGAYNDFILAASGQNASPLKKQIERG